MGMTGDYIFSFQAKDGTELHIRLLRPEDAPYLVELFKHMGPESRYLRFNLALTNPDPDLIWREARRLAQIDPEKDGAWLVFAERPGEDDMPVGGVRYMRTDADTAEASLVVRDDMQNKGVGRALLDFLVDRAREAGLKKLTATIQRGNLPLWHLLSTASLRVERKPQGISTLITAYLSDNGQIESQAFPG
jgi:acetyltransferase